MSGLVWVELDAKAPEHNLRQLRRASAPNVLACAVVKANAYGHGVAPVASLLPSADWFGVNSASSSARCASQSRCSCSAMSRSRIFRPPSRRT